MLLAGQQLHCNSNHLWMLTDPCKPFYAVAANTINYAHMRTLKQGQLLLLLPIACVHRFLNIHKNGSKCLATAHAYLSLQSWSDQAITAWHKAIVDTHDSS